MLKPKLFEKFVMAVIIVTAASGLMNINGKAASINSNNQRTAIVMLMGKPQYKFFGKHSVIYYEKCLIKKFHSSSKSEINQFKKDAHKLEHQFDL